MDANVIHTYTTIHNLLELFYIEKKNAVNTIYEWSIQLSSCAKIHNIVCV